MIRRLNWSFLRRIFALGDPRWGQSGSGNPDDSRPSSGSQNAQGGQGGRDPGGDQDPQEPPVRGNQGSGQKRPANEPPDLDEVWRDFNKRLSGLFGGKSGRGGGFGGGNNNRRGAGGPGGAGGGGFKSPSLKTGPTVAAVLAGGVLLWLASGFYIIQEGQSSIVLRFGEYRTTAGAGFQWRLPYPFESHEVVDLSQIRQVTVGIRGSAPTRGRDSLMLTRDENIVDLQFAVQYRISDPKSYLFNNVGTDEIVAQAAETAMREIVGRSLSDTVLYENKEGIAREALAQIQTIADRYQSGLGIIDVTIQNVQPPEEVQAAFSDAIKAGQDAERLKNEGQAYANEVIPRARGSAERLIQEAEGYRERVIAVAQGDSDRFRKIVVEYNKAPAVTRERMYLETMQQVFTNVSKVMVDSKSNSNLLYLPLDRLLQQTGSGAANPASAMQPQSGAAQPQQGAASANETPSPAPSAPAPGLRDRLRESR